ncbi:MAG: hypothetical protein HKO53_04600, partial [Gemmatimonadetes bacterium]|nr:hypothetical protein [Gemmatimonadota bacterium]
MTKGKLNEYGIWGYAFGYFACYVPYSAMTKALSSGMLDDVEAPSSGFVLLPVSVGASLLGMITFISLMGWWKYASQRTIGGR